MVRCDADYAHPSRGGQPRNVGRLSLSALRKSCADASEASWEQLGPIADAGGNGDEIIERLIQDHIRHAGAKEAGVTLPATKIGVWKATLSQLVCDMKRNPILLGMHLDSGDRRCLEARVVGLAAAACVHAPNGPTCRGMDVDDDSAVEYERLRCILGVYDSLQYHSCRVL